MTKSARWLLICCLAVGSGAARAHDRLEPSSHVRPAEKPVSRTIDFPAVSLGGLYILPANFDGMQMEIHEFAVAKGRMTVQLPKGKELLLRGNSNLLNRSELLDSLPSDSLDCIELRAVFLDDEKAGQGDKVMAHLTRLTGLKVVLMSNLNVSDVGLAAFGKVKNLRKLSASLGSVTGSCFKELRALPDLKILVLTDNSLQMKHFHYLADFPQLQRLDLHNCNVDDSGLKALVKCPKLTILSLSANPKLTDAGLKSIGQIESLEFLDLQETKVTTAGLTELSQLKHLKQVLVSSRYLAPNAVSALNEKYPTLKLKMRFKNKAVDKDVARIFAPLK